ncbi:usp44 [Acrasis kona]|uniref:Usp44 n=1 Tax=Acrasis kona TaxID=1008807 RepID=A0AAW2ZDI3_9EUKA
MSKPSVNGYSQPSAPPMSAPDFDFESYIGDLSVPSLRPGSIYDEVKHQKTQSATTFNITPKQVTPHSPYTDQSIPVQHRRTPSPNQTSPSPTPTRQISPTPTYTPQPTTLTSQPRSPHLNTYDSPTSVGRASPNNSTQKRKGYSNILKQYEDQQLSGPKEEVNIPPPQPTYDYPTSNVPYNGVNIGNFYPTVEPVPVYQIPPSQPIHKPTKPGMDDRLLKKFYPTKYQ